MHVKNNVIVKGAGFFTGNIEGIDHDTGQVFIEEPFDKSKANYKGFRTVEYKCTDSTVVKPLMHNEFPISCEATMEISATKRGQVILVTHLKPLERVSGTPRVQPSA